MMVGARPVRPAHPPRPRHPRGRAGPRGRRPDGRQPDRVIQLDVPARRHHGRRGGAALPACRFGVDPLERRLPARRQGVHRRRPRRHRQPARRPARRALLGWPRTRLGAVRHPSGATSSPSCCSSSSCCSGPPACWVSRSERHAHEPIRAHGRIGVGQPTACARRSAGTGRRAPAARSEARRWSSACWRCSSTRCRCWSRRSSPRPTPTSAACCSPSAMLRAGRPRPQHRGRLRRPARPRLRRLLRHRRLHRRRLRPRSTAQLAVAWLAASRSPSLADDDLRRHARRADAAGARRLPRHRDARLRRDHPADRGQHRSGSARPAASPTSPRPPSVELFEIPHLTGTADAARRPRRHDDVPGVRRARPDPVLLAGPHA